MIKSNLQGIGPRPTPKRTPCSFVSYNNASWNFSMHMYLWSPYYKQPPPNIYASISIVVFLLQWAATCSSCHCFSKQKRPKWSLSDQQTSGRVKVWSLAADCPGNSHAMAPKCVCICVRARVFYIFHQVTALSDRLGQIRQTDFIPKDVKWRGGGRERVS